MALTLPSRRPSEVVDYVRRTPALHIAGPEGMIGGMSSVFEDAGTGLRRERLYVHPEAEVELLQRGIDFGADAQAAVRDVLAEATTPVYVAVLPESAASGTARDVAVATGASGSYLVVLSNERLDTAHDMGFPEGALGRAARNARADSGGDLATLITDFVERTEDLAAGGTGVPGGGAGEAPSGGSGYLPLGILLAAGGGGFLLYRRQKRQRELTELNQVRDALDEDITAYGEELAALDLDVRSDEVPEAAQDEYAQALDLYEHAKSAAARAERPDHLRPVTAALEHGRWLQACVRARVDGEAVPERRPPCFFDPRHGPAVADVSWTPPGGVPREVPACQADAVRLQEGQDPDARMVTVDGERRPYWEAGPAYSAWAAGYYGGFLPGMLWGTMLGTAFAHGPAYAGGAGGFEDGGGFDGGFEDGGGFDGGFEGGGGFDGGGFGGFDF
jgi:hypothetical protein